MSLLTNTQAGDVWQQARSIGGRASAMGVAFALNTSLLRFAVTSLEFNFMLFFFFFLLKTDKTDLI